MIIVEKKSSHKGVWRADKGKWVKGVHGRKGGRYSREGWCEWWARKVRWKVRKGRRVEG